MKRFVALLTALALLLALTACGKSEENLSAPSLSSETEESSEAEESSGTEQSSEEDEASEPGSEEEEWVDDRSPSPMIFEWTIEEAMDGAGKTLTYTRIPSYLEDFQLMDLTDPYQSAAAAVLVLCMYEYYPVPALEVLDYLNGSEDVSAYDKSFLEEQFAQYPYVARSFMDGATPENGYEVEPYAFTFFENDYSRTDDTHITLWIYSGGAESPREVTLKLEGDSWYLSNYAGLVAGVQAPADEG